MNFYTGEISKAFLLNYLNSFHNKAHNFEHILKSLNINYTIFAGDI